mmetsp:Transcript_38439/g.69282  ORF Transcript_38439/g.69282 Transcript_38439/m.69282 type:complete len:204 (+) Transcript_38439:351-962(+)
MDASIQHKLSGHLGARTEGQYWNVGPKCRDHTRQNSLRSQYNNRSSISFFRSSHSRLGNGSIHTFIRSIQLSLHESFPRRKIETRHGIFGKVFGTGYNLIHGLDDLDWIFALGCFSREHDTVGSVVDGICDIGNFCTCWPRILCHGFKHLRSHNHWLPSSIASRHHLFLSIGNLLNWDLHSEIPTCHHDTITLFQYLIEVRAS